MYQLEEQLKRINEKVQHLLRQNQVLQKENEKLNRELTDLKDKQVHQSRKLDEYEQQISVLKMAAVQLDDKDKRELEKRLNGYIREN